MTLVPTNLELRQGDDLAIRVPNVRDANDIPITNWTGITVHAQVRDRVSSTAVLYEWTSVGPGANVTFSGSNVLLAVPNTSSAWTWLFGYYDVKLTDAAGKIATIAKGHMTIERGVTR